MEQQQRRMDIARERKKRRLKERVVATAGDHVFEQLGVSRRLADKIVGEGEDACGRRFGELGQLALQLAHQRMQAPFGGALVDTRE